MEKYSFNKEWYKSSRLRVVLVAVILLVANDMFGIGLPDSTVEMIVGLAMVYISGKSLQDALASQAEVRAKAISEAAKQNPPSP